MLEERLELSIGMLEGLKIEEEALFEGKLMPKDWALLQASL
jgi:hypothetical protein